MGSDDNGKLIYEREIGRCLVDVSALWQKISEGDEALIKHSQTYHLKVYKGLAIEDFDQHGDLLTNIPEEVPEGIEIRMNVVVQKVPLSGADVSRPRKRSLLYKHDDDLRQELFAINFVKSCDQILRSCGLDLKLLTFRCIPVGQQRGFIEWIHGSVPLSEICQPLGGFILGGTKPDPPRSDIGRPDPNAAEDALSSVAKAGLTKYEAFRRVESRVPGSANPIQDFFRAFHYAPNDPYMVRKSVMETYIKSCAGYCAITYILGVGDRHLDNLLLHPTGHFFHCDYSFILGHDPKRYLPLRITEDMVNGMGGRESDNYAMFMSLTCAAFLTFRRPENVRHAMSFVRLMDGSCTFASSNGDTKLPLETALLGIRQRLRLDLPDDEAILFMERLVEESCSSKMWIAVDAIHSIGKRF
jgi:phosphatidylinositol 3-kinase